MKKIAILTAGLALMLRAQATTIVEITQAAPNAPALSGETMLSYDCFIVKGGTMRQAMGKTPEASLAGVSEVVAYLNADFAANYETLLAGNYTMVRDENRMDFRNSTGSSFNDYFGLVVYNPVDGTKTGTGDIAYYRVFNMGSKTQINDSLPMSGVWSDWQAAAAVPEPTSGLLFLMGLAGLALRRRKG